VSRQLLQQHEDEDVATLPVTPAPALGLAETPVSAALGPHQMLALQRTAGNAAVSAYLRRASLQRCGGPGACDCADCGADHEHDDADDLEGVAHLAQKGALRRRATQHVDGKEELAGPGAGGGSSAIPSIDGEEEEEMAEEAGAPAADTATPGQEVVHRARSVARTRMLQRAAAFAAGPVHEVNNLAAAIINNTPVGVTWPTLNGTQFWSTGEAQGLINRPTLATAAAGAGFESQVDNIPNNAGSFDETVLANGPWRLMTTKANVVANVGALAGACGGAGNSRFRAYGKPSDAAMFAANRRHEDHHADDHRDAFNASISPWDTALTNAKTAGTKFNGNTAAAAEGALWAAMGGTPDDVAADYFNRCQAAVITYHGSAAGGPVGPPENPGSRNSCTISWAKYTNPS
jgi:hypothetical protein